MRPIAIEGFEKYLINEEGVVLNQETGRVLRTDLTNMGYRRVTLSSDGETLRIAIHKLVALMFVDGFKEGYVVNHKDGNKINNHKDNLEWVSHSDNRKHAFKNRLCSRPNSKINDRKVHEVCEMIRDGYTAKQVQTLMEISKHIYDDIHSRRSYKNISIQYLW